jgi:6-phosphogluconolactonase
MSNSIERAFVYVANADSRELLVFDLNLDSGELTLIEHVLGGKFTTIACTPDRRFMFAGLRDEPFAIASFAIDPVRGKLRPLGETRMPGPLAFLSIDTTGRWLLSASYHGNFVAVAEITSSGELKSPQQIIESIEKAHCILPSPSNDMVVATALGSDRLMVWPWDSANGRLDDSRRVETAIDEGTGPRHVRFVPHASNQLLLIGELDASIRLFEYDAALHFRQLAKSSTAPKGFRGKRWGAELHVSPDGRFAFASERTSSTLSVFETEPSGSALPSRATVPTERQPRAFAIDPTGRFLFVAGQKSNRLSAYAIDAETGVPSKLGDHATGGDPCWVEIIGVGG